MFTALAGVILFVWFVRRVGPAEIWTGLRQVGWGILAIVAIAGFRFALRAAAWRLCLDPPHAMPFATAFEAILAGDAVGNLTPLGLIASEPAKAAFVRQSVPLAPVVTSLAIENLFYTFSVALMIAASTTALLFSFELPPAMRHAGWIAIVTIMLLLIAAALTLWKRPSVIGRVLSVVTPARGLQTRLERVRAIEDQIYTFALRRQAILAPLFACEAGYHALGVLEIHITWWLMQGVAPPLLTSFILEGVNRLITVAFKFVPLRLGVDEWGTGSFTQLLGYGAAPGVTLAIIRKVRVVFWVLIGTALLIRRGLGTTSRTS
jgi:hypothetical protein